MKGQSKPFAIVLRRGGSFLFGNSVAAAREGEELGAGSGARAKKPKRDRNRAILRHVQFPSWERVDVAVLRISDWLVKYAPV